MEEATLTSRVLHQFLPAACTPLGMPAMPANRSKAGETCQPGKSRQVKQEARGDGVEQATVPCKALTNFGLRQASWEEAMTRAWNCQRAFPSLTRSVTGSL